MPLANYLYKKIKNVMMAIIYNVFINVVRLALIIFGMVIAMTIVCEWNTIHDCKELGTYVRFY